MYQLEVETFKSEKGKSRVLLNRNNYIKQISDMLSGSCKFEKLDKKLEKEFNSLLQQEQRLFNFLEKVKKFISDQLYKELDPRGSQTGWEWFGNVWFS